MTDMSPAELTAKIVKALEVERSVPEVAQHVGCDTTVALNIMLQLAGAGRIELTDSLHKKWALKTGWGKKDGQRPRPHHQGVPEGRQDEHPRDDRQALA